MAQGKQGGGASAEVRKRLLAEMALKRMSVREIADALARLPAQRRPAACSTSAVGRDLKELRDEWAAARAADVEMLVGEEVARLNELERVWWPEALKKDKEATDRVLAIQRQRVQLLRIGPGSGGARGGGGRGGRCRGGAWARDGGEGAGGAGGRLAGRVGLDGARIGRGSDAGA